MIERLKCCINILFAKQYIVFTADKYKMGKFGSGYIRTTNKAFLQAAIEVIEEIDSHLIEKKKKTKLLWTRNSRRHMVSMMA